MAKEKKAQGCQWAAGLIRYVGAEDSNALQISRWGVLLGGILAIAVVEVSTAVGLQTGAYVLAVGLSAIVFNEFRISRSRTL
jgi:preprotein translocase subunit Sec61beta